jgi:hypothetical protein
MEKKVFQFKILENTFHEGPKTKVVQYFNILIYIINNILIKYFKI